MKKSKNQLMKLSFYLLLFFVVSCSTARFRYETKIDLEDGSKAQYSYEKSYEVKSDQLWCIITGVFYGGWCWAYLAMPRDSQSSQLKNDAKTKLVELTKRNDLKLLNGNISRTSWDDKEESVVLNDYPKPKSKTSTADVKPEPKQEKKYEDSLSLELTPQKAYKDGKQKIIAYINNNSNKLFKGRLYVSVRSAIDEEIFWDTIYLKDALAPDSKTFAILWIDPFKVAFIDHYKWETKGSFTEIEVDSSTQQLFEETGKYAGQNYMSIFVYPIRQDDDSLLKIINRYKKLYGNLNGFQILFFNNKKNAPSDFPISKAANKANFATYYWNSNSKLDKLEFRKN